MVVVYTALVTVFARAPLNICLCPPPPPAHTHTAAPAECSLSVAFEAKWYIVEALPIMLAVSIVVVVAGVRVMQVCQRVVFRRLPFGATSDTSLTDVVIGIFITGLFYLYFRTWFACCWGLGGGGERGTCSCDESRVVHFSAPIPMLCVEMFPVAWHWHVWNLALFCVFLHRVPLLFLVCVVVCTPVVVRNSLLPFDCSTRDGLSTMDAEPSIVCDTDNPVFYRMRNVAATCLLLYGMGVPAFFAGFVFKYVGMHCASFVCLASFPCTIRKCEHNVGGARWYCFPGLWHFLV